MSEKEFSDWSHNMGVCMMETSGWLPGIEWACIRRSSLIGYLG